MIDMIELILDRAVAALGLLILVLPMLAVAVLVKVDSPGSVRHRQVRVGRRRQPLTMYEFRSVVDGAEEPEHPPAESAGQDERLIFDLRWRLG